MMLDCETEETLPKQQEELKAQVQTHEDKDEALAAKVEDQNREIEFLRQQLKEMDKALQSAKGECEALHQRIKCMNGMVAREGAMRYQDESMRKGLYQQLTEVKRQLEKERRLKNKFMAAEKKARNEAEQLRELQRVSSNVKPAQDELEKTEALKKLEEVKVEYSNSRQKFAALIQEEQEKSKGLERVLELLKVSYNEIKLKYETDLNFEKDKNNTLQKVLQQERDYFGERISDDLEIFEKLKADKDQLRQQKQEEIRILQQRERSLTKALVDLRSQLNIKAEEEGSQDLKQKNAEQRVEVVQREKVPLCDSQALELLEEVCVSAENLPTKNKKSSLWKRFCRFTGLKKRERKNSECN